jgi:phage terminase large subunit-like protein
MARHDRKITSVLDVFKEMSDGLSKLAYAPDINSYNPHAKQEKFHKSQKNTRLYIGGNRSGKTTGGIVEDIRWLTRKHPYYNLPDRPIAGRIVSVDFSYGIAQIIIPQLKQWIPPSQLKGGSWFSAYEAGLKVLHFENGSSVELMSYEQDVEKFAGTSRDFIHYDEEPPKAIYDECQARLIDRKGRSWITMTPVEGMTWIFDTLYQPGIAGSSKIDVIEVDMAENPYLDPEAIEEFLSGLDEDDRKARGQGKFVQMGGLVYKSFKTQTHVIEPIDPSELRSLNYRWYMSLDHGFNNPTAVLWHAVDKDNRVITFAEHYDREKTIDYHADVIKQREKDWGRKADVRVCDPALEQRQAVTGTSIQTEYAIRGIGMALGNNDVLTGVAKVNQYLDMSADKKPNWLITANCANLITELQRLRWKTWSSKKQASQNNVHDQIHKKDDHACDSARYMFSFLPELKPIIKVKTPVEIPRVGGSSAVLPNITTTPRIDPNLTPSALGKKTEWKVVLNDEG